MWNPTSDGSEVLLKSLGLLLTVYKVDNVYKGKATQNGSYLFSVPESEHEVVVRSNLVVSTLFKLEDTKTELKKLNQEMLNEFNRHFGKTEETKETKDIGSKNL